MQNRRIICAKRMSTPNLWFHAFSSCLNKKNVSKSAVTFCFLEHTPGPWLVRFSVVRFPLMQFFKKYPKNSTGADYSFIRAFCIQLVLIPSLMLPKFSSRLFLRSCSNNVSCPYSFTYALYIQPVLILNRNNILLSKNTHYFQF